MIEKYYKDTILLISDVPLVYKNLYTYKWYINDVLYSESYQYFHKFDNLGIYHIKLVTTNIDNKLNNISEKTVSIIVPCRQSVPLEEQSIIISSLLTFTNTQEVAGNILGKRQSGLWELKYDTSAQEDTITRYVQKTPPLTDDTLGDVIGNSHVISFTDSDFYLDEFYFRRFLFAYSDFSVYAVATCTSDNSSKIEIVNVLSNTHLLSASLYGTVINCIPIDTSSILVSVVTPIGEYRDYYIDFINNTTTYTERVKTINGHNISMIASDIELENNVMYDCRIGDGYYESGSDLFRVVYSWDGVSVIQTLLNAPGYMPNLSVKPICYIDNEGILYSYQIVNYVSTQTKFLLIHADGVLIGEMSLEDYMNTKYFLGMFLYKNMPVLYYKDQDRSEVTFYQLINNGSYYFSQLNNWFNIINRGFDDGLMLYNLSNSINYFSTSDIESVEQIAVSGDNKVTFILNERNLA